MNCSDLAKAKKLDGLPVHREIKPIPRTVDPTTLLFTIPIVTDE